MILNTNNITNDIFERERHNEIYSYCYMEIHVKKIMDFVDISFLAENNIRKPRDLVLKSAILDDTLR